jgi:hypothetical protein
MSRETKSPAVIRRAHDMVSALCDGSRDWIMSIPARPDHDPDLVIGEALRVADAMQEALECAEDAETIRHVIVLGDEFHAICDKWRARAEELLSDSYSPSERFPGWVGSAMRELSLDLRRLALAKARGVA